jgi:hypothetical protein
MRAKLKLTPVLCMQSWANAWNPNKARPALSLFRAERLTWASPRSILLCAGIRHKPQSLADELVKRFPQETITINIVNPMIRAAIENNRGQYAKAIEILQPASRFELGNVSGFWINYLRAGAFTGQRSGKEAAVEYQKILDHRAVDFFSPLYPLAHLGLARAAALSGDTAKSRTEYQNFFAAWKDAYADLPVLVQAKKEYEQLK